MSWIQKLYDTYEQCQTSVGDPNDSKPLLPICHTTQKAQLQIILDSEGKFVNALVVPKKESRTIIPCTELSMGRANGEAPYPLCDKLQYVAKDYLEYGGDKKHYHSSYKELLSKWVNSKYANEYIQAVYQYISKGTVIGDLVNAKILYTDNKDKLIKKWSGEQKEKPELFTLFQNEAWQAEAFVRWEVRLLKGNPETKVWLNKKIWESWINYYKSTKSNQSLCYVSGKIDFSADRHPSKIRNDGDSARLISSNDDSGFTFLGRFSNSSQAFNLSFEVTQKAHNALQWLINKQGYINGDGNQVFVAWAVSGKQIPDPYSDTLGLFPDEEMNTESISAANTAQVFATNFNKLMAGYTVKLGVTESINVIGLDSASPGRLAIIFYRELTGSEFLERIQTWHSSSAWIQNYGQDFKTKKQIRFIGAPSPKDIALIVYGMLKEGEGKSKVIKATIERIIPCIIDGNKIPFDIVQSCVRRVSNRISFEEIWQWDKALGITCSIFKNFYRERGYKMSLEKDRNTRDYLYGRLLAIADRIEGLALYKAGEKRETSAARLMQRFSEQPFETWKNIELSLSPYKARLGGANFFQNQIDEIMGLFNSNDYLNNNRLSGEFLLGYHCQRKELNTYKVDDSNTDDAQVSENSNS
ncbi:MAG: type I-C CRISPR-associated protein Cas8c/Csd1 [Leptospiraceae bacterium]|nr:type I-C CRISPR-associated protein Cas8c/Csd1 [Leptospiraceae bacterium]MBK9501546.1 type I-C CRISPR-associated protein Cas8c/Csd1 [Leptospiraceae bacterium]MBP9889213.1 type I-C CRISPR-associated protein Cas8c/Csd1 [Leptospiraceae bacterium]